MANPLSAIRAKIRQFLKDEFVSGQEFAFKDDEIDLHIQDCLVEISESRPYEVKETLKTTASSKELDISSIDGLLDVPKVEYPVGAEPPEYRNCSIFGNTLQIDIDSLPSANEDVYLYCHKVHEVTETSSSLRPHLERVLVMGVMAKVALSWVNQIRTQLKAAIDGISGIDTAIGNMSGRITQAISDLTAGRAYIAKKNTEAITAIDSMSSQITQALSDLTTGRALIGDKKTEAVAALGNVSARITQAITDLTSGRSQIDDERATADTAIDSVNARITQALADLTSGRSLINRINVGGAPQTDYANFAARELQSASEYLRQASGYLSEAMSSGRHADYATRDLQTARAYIDEARGYMSLDQVTTEHANYALRQLSSASSYLTQARGYLDVDRPASEYGGYAARELSNATAYLNQAGGYIRQLTARLNIGRAISGYQNLANNYLALYQRGLAGIAEPTVYREYPKS